MRCFPLTNFKVSFQSLVSFIGEFIETLVCNSKWIIRQLLGWINFQLQHMLIENSCKIILCMSLWSDSCSTPCRLKSCFFYFSYLHKKWSHWLSATSCCGYLPPVGFFVFCVIFNFNYKVFHDLDKDIECHAENCMKNPSSFLMFPNLLIRGAIR